MALSGCTRANGWSEAPAADHAEALETAKAAAADLGGRLLARVTGVAEEVGLPGAIDVCRVEARAIAKQVSEQRGVEIGRTSHRLRSPSNRPPEWVRDLEATEPKVYVNRDGRVGVTLPIRAKEMCMGCHGAAERIPAEVADALGKAYPRDAATGFAPGDLRGQFWVEIP